MRPFQKKTTIKINKRLLQCFFLIEKLKYCIEDIKRLFLDDFIRLFFPITNDPNFVFTKESNPRALGPINFSLKCIVLLFESNMHMMSILITDCFQTEKLKFLNWIVFFSLFWLIKKFLFRVDEIVLVLKCDDAFH